jgi:endonuclease/exonuclease/phosphatase (EEP) superfamily protein YafD
MDALPAGVVIRSVRTLVRAGWRAVPWALLAPAGLAQASVLSGRIGPVVVLWVVAVTPHLVVVSLGVLGGALLRRRLGLGAVAAVMSVTHLAVLWPALGPPSTPPASPAVAPLRVVFANVFRSNPSLDDALAVVAARSPDVVVLAEAGAADDDRLRRAGLLDDYPFRVPLDRVRSGFVIRSRLPVRVERGFTGRQFPDFTVDVGGTEVRIVAVHLRSAVDTATSRQWKAQFERLEDQLAADDRPALVIGDFNATRWHGPYRRLAAGLTDVHDRTGMGLSTSWPVRPMLPGLIRIDHALVRGALRADAVADLTVPGSDHRGIVIDLGLDPASR